MVQNNRIKQCLYLVLAVIVVTAYLLPWHQEQSTDPASAQEQNYDWFTVGNNPERTGYTPETVVVNPPISLLWQRTFQYENIATIVQVVTGGGLAYIGTLGRDDGSINHGGKVHALSPNNGSEVWTYADLKGGLAHSLSYSDYLGGTVIGATTMGELFALNAGNGQLRWKAETGFGGFVVNPLILDNTILLGGRDGYFYAYNLNGTQKWKINIGVPIANTAAGKDGVVYFLDEGMRAHALNITNGTHLPGWPNTQDIYGGSARDYWPVIFGNYVMFRVAPAHGYAWAQTENALGVEERSAEDVSLPLCPDPNESVINYLNTNSGKYDQTLYILNRTTGQKVSTAAAFYVSGSGNVTPPPVISKNGEIIIVYRTRCSMWDHTSWVNPYSAMGILDPESGYVSQIVPAQEYSWGDFWIISDESVNFTIAGDTLLVSHQGNWGSFNFITKLTRAGFGLRDKFGGFDAVSWARQEWHGAARNPLTVSNGVIYYVAGGRVIANNAR